MRPTVSLLLVLLAAAGPRAPAAAADAGDGKVYVIPIEGMIERGLVYVVRRGVAQAEAEGAGAVVFDMDTPGGRLDAAEEIIRMIRSLDVRTVTYVNPSAISAGAILAMATRDIYMAPGSRIGDAMPIMMSPFGGAQEMPEAIEEKTVSYVAGLMRAAAQQGGHDDQLAEAMVRREMEYKIGDDVICPAGQLLTLTNVEAERTIEADGQSRKLLSAGTVETLDALLAEIGLGSADRVVLMVTPAEKMARVIEMLSALLLIGGLIGLYIEFKTPGFGVPGIAGILLLVIWFWGHHIAGLAGLGELVILLLGITFLAIEIFVTPGFGVLGVTGIALILAAIVMAMVQHDPGIPWYRPPAADVEKAVKVGGGSLLGTFVLALILGRYLPEMSPFRRLVLAQAVGGQEGYRASTPSDELLGLRGTALTPLHPSGIGNFQGRRVNVVARGAFIEKDAPIVIAETHGNRIVVDAAEGGISNGAGEAGA